MELYSPNGASPIKLSEADAAAFIRANGLVRRETINGEVYHLTTTPAEAASLRQAASEFVPEVKLRPITPLQIRLALIGAGFTMEHVRLAIDAIEDPAQQETARVSWEYASQFERDNQLINLVGAAMGLDEDQIDTLWLEAMNIK